MNHIEKLLPSIIIIHITKVTHRSAFLAFLAFFATVVSSWCYPSKKSGKTLTTWGQNKGANPF